ncbi:hypothetical protein [Streptomyces adustus]
MAPGPLKDLKDFLFDLYERSGGRNERFPTLDKIAEEAQAAADADEELEFPGTPARDVIREILTQDAIPKQLGNVKAIAIVLARRAHENTDAVEGQVDDLWEKLGPYKKEVERYHKARASETALVETVVDADRMGHSCPISRAVLEMAAPSYLPARELSRLSEHWVEQALDLHFTDGFGFLRRSPHLDHSRYNEPHYSVAKYVDQHVRWKRRNENPPTELWTALIEHGNRAHLFTPGYSAWQRGYLRVAIHLYRLAAESGDGRAIRYGAYALNGAGRLPEAIAWLEIGAMAGDRHAARDVAKLLQTARCTDGVPEEEDFSTESGRLRRYGREPDGTIAEPWTCTPPSRS